MSVRSTSALRRIHEVRRVQRLAMIFAGSVFAAGSTYSFITKIQKEKAQPIVNHALTICRVFAADCQPEGEARFLHEQSPLPSTRRMNRPMWYVPLRADGASYAMMLRADTGRMCYLFHLTPWENIDTAQSPKSPPIEASRAINQSLLYLQRLKAVAPDTQIALEGKAEPTREKMSWRIVWKIRTSPDAAEEMVRVVISQKNGKLLQLADTAALNQAIQR